MHKKLLPVLLCLSLLLTLPFPAFAADSTPLVVSTPGALIRLAENCRLDSYSQNLRVQLGADIDMTGLDFRGIPIFCGSFDGAGFTVSGVEIQAPGSVVGFFRYLTEGASVQNLHIAGNVQPQGSKSFVGGIAGSNAGSIQNCSFTGHVSGSDAVGGIVGTNLVTGILENCTTAGSVDGSHFVGGLAGQNTGVIRLCGNYAQINTTPQQNTVDISDITLESLTGAESAATVTDIGGIAGSNRGVIRECKNHADVGYKHMGYNVGGIAGSQGGYITDCENFHAVSGRKEVGGIVGHMEPVVRVDFSEDTLQTLRGQLAAMGELTDKATASAQGGAAAVSNQISALQQQAQAAEDALSQLLPSVSDPDGGRPEVSIPDADSIQAAQNALAESLSGMQGSLQGLASAAQGTAGALSGSMGAISRQMDEISQTINGASENLGGTVTDISDMDTASDTTGKVTDCRNYGTVLADLNAGGIAGAIALENDLDPEEDLSINGDTSLHFDSMLRAVITSCRNEGSVTAKKQNTGGIVGWMDLGLVKNTMNTGEITGGEYVGGIAGRSNGYLRSCGAKCPITADRYAGGIAGTARVLTDCRSMVALNASERLGAILGSTQDRQQITGNFYLPVGEDPGAIDGISYNSHAQPLEQEAFLSLPGLNRRFRNVTVSFLFEDGQKTVLTLAPGQMLATSDIPELPQKQSFTASWEGLDDPYILFDTTFRAVYTPYATVIQSTDLRQNGKPILLAEGSFSPEASISVKSSTLVPEGNVIEALTVSVSADTQDITWRYLPPEAAGEEILLYTLSSDGSWQPAEVRKGGSYLVFTAQSGEATIALVRQNSHISGWVFAAGAAVVLLTLLGVFIAGRKRAKKKK